MKLNNVSFILGGALTLSACGSSGSSDFGPELASAATQSAVSDFPVIVGEPYTIGGKTYTPEDVSAYDEVGYASWYGGDFNGKQTANGEIFSASGFSGAHKTLPLPSYAEVTNLDTGRTILVRLNDRGPFADDRLIDLSEAAARQLGIIEQGVAGVRVRKVNPPEQERAILRNGGEASLRSDTPDSLTRILRDRLGKLPVPKAPVRVAAPASNSSSQNATGTSQNRDGRFIVEGSGRTANRPNVSNSSSADGRFIVEGASGPNNAPVASGNGFIVQLSSFSSRSRADALARKVGGNVVPSSDGRLFRVRFGPYSTEAQAQQGLAKARQQGYPQARIFRE